MEKSVLLWCLSCRNKAACSSISWHLKISIQVRSIVIECAAESTHCRSCKDICAGSKRQYYPADGFACKSASEARFQGPGSCQRNSDQDSSAFSFSRHASSQCWYRDCGHGHHVGSSMHISYASVPVDFRAAIASRIQVIHLIPAPEALSMHQSALKPNLLQS